MRTVFQLYCEVLDPNLSFLSTYNPKIFPLNYIINFQKGFTLAMMFSLMVYFNNFSLGAWIYLALHGSYGIIWYVKDMVVPDKSFQMNVNPVVFIVTGSILLCYWGIGFLMMSGIADNNPSPERIFVCIILYVFGVSLMLVTDLQKYITLNFKKGLIDNYYLSNNRNTNYFGEMMLYSGFAVLTGHYISYCILLGVWMSVFVSRIYMKEKSLSKKDGYAK